MIVWCAGSGEVTFDREVFQGREIRFAIVDLSYCGVVLVGKVQQVGSGNQTHLAISRECLEFLRISSQQEPFSNR